MARLQWAALHLSMIVTTPPNLWAVADQGQEAVEQSRHPGRKLTGPMSLIRAQLAHPSGPSQPGSYPAGYAGRPARPRYGVDDAFMHTWWSSENNAQLPGFWQADAVWAA